MMGPRLTVPCPHCGVATPAGLPRNMMLLAIVGRTCSPEELDCDSPFHVESRCPSGHEVHVYYERQYSTPLDDS